MRYVLRLILFALSAAFGLFIAMIANGDILKADTVRIETPHEPVGQAFQAPAVTMTRVDSDAKELPLWIADSIVSTCSQSVEGIYYNRSRIYLKCVQDELTAHGYTAEFANEDDLYIILNTNDRIMHPTQ